MDDTFGQTLLSDTWVGIPEKVAGSDSSSSHDASFGWVFKTTSDNPCPICKYLDGKYTPYWPPKPHSHCACYRDLIYQQRDYLGRKSLGKEEWEAREPYKEIAPHGSLTIGREESIQWSYEMGLSIGDEISSFGGFSYSETTTFEEDMSIGNDTDEPRWAYHVYRFIREYFADWWAYGSVRDRVRTSVQGYRERVYYRVLDYGDDPDNWSLMDPPPPKTYEDLKDPGYHDEDAYGPNAYPRWGARGVPNPMR